MLKLWPYKPASRSAKALAKALNVKRIVSPGYKQKQRDFILNWGRTNFQHNSPRGDRVINHTYNVNMAADKIAALMRMRVSGVSMPDFTVTKDIAQGWLERGDKVVVRALTRSHSGLGASVVEEGNLPYAPLYTKYFKRDGEYRVHIFNGKVIDYVRKKRRNGYSESDTHNDYIRTHLFGWVFCRNGVVLPDEVRNQSMAAVAALGLTFGAVDVCWRESDNKAVVLEVNTAPGLEGTTLTRYVEAIRNYIQLRERVPRSRSW